MKTFNIFSRLCSPLVGSQSSDVGFDRRFTVGSPSFDRRSTMLKLVSVLAILLTIGVGQMRAASFSTTYGYSDKGTTWTLTDCEDKSSYWRCPATGNTSVANISNIFKDKYITSAITITINHATFGSGSNPNEQSFQIYTSSSCAVRVNATKSGDLATKDSYKNVVYTISSADAAYLGNDLSILITKPGKTIRLKSITVAFTYSAASTYTVTWKNNGSTYTTTSVTQGRKATFPSTPTSCDGTSTTFYGWSTAEWNGKLDDVSEKTIYTTQETMPVPTTNVTYYAVFGVPGAETSAAFTASNISSTPATSNALEWKHTASGALLHLSGGQRYTSGSPNTFSVAPGSTNYIVVAGVYITKVVAACTSTTYRFTAASAGTFSNPSSSNYQTAGVNGFEVKMYAGNGSNQARATTVTVYYKPFSAYLTKCTSCDAPTSPVKGSINASSQTVSWTDAANAAGGYLVAYSTIETTAPAPSVKSAGTSGNYTVVAIASGTKTADIPCNAAGTYNWWVRSKCSADSYSDWVDGSSWTMKTIYLNTNYDWNAGGAKFAVHYWNDDPTPKSGWSKLMTEQTDCLGGIYKVLVPDGYNNINFGRFSTAQVTDPTDWTNRWNQTADLTIPSSPAKDYFTLSSKTGDYDYNGSWSNYTQSFQISFNLNKGGASFSTYPASAPDSRCVAIGSTTAAPTDPVALGKVINGWYKESGCSNQWVFASQTVSANQELFANWEDVATKTIYLDASASLSGGNRWDQDGATDLVMFAHAYINNTGNPGLYYDVKMTAVSTCQPHVYSCAIPGNATHVSFARCASGTTELPATWTNPPVYNQIAGKTVESGKNLYTITDWGAATLESSPFAPASYTMSYAAGTTPNKGGAAITGSKSSESKACDVTYTLPSSAVFSVTGYRQTAWTTSDGGTQTHAFSGSYTTNADQAFYPVWAANTYQVAFNANGGSGSAMSNQSFTYDEAAKPLTSNTYTAPGEHKYFAGWATSSSRASAGTVDYTDGQSVSNLSSTHNATVTLYAVWKDHTYENYRTSCADQYNIVLDKNGGDANGSAKVAANGTTLSSIVAPTKNGYDVEGYYTTSGLATKIATDAGALQASINVGGDDWTDGDRKWVLSAGATFYTKWTAHEYTITYEGLEGASNTNPTSYTIETATIVLANPGSRTGYTFTGWTISGSPVTQITVGSTGDKTITANWSINTPNLAVSAADHVVITATPASELAIAEGANRNVNYNKTITLNCTPDEHWNLVWDVYKTGESSTKVALSGSGDGATFTMPDYGVTVSAVMTEATYHTATFKNNGTAIDGYDGVKTYDGTKPSAPTLTDVTDACDKTDCNKFYGWIAEDAIWSKTINSVAGKTIYRRAADIPNVSGADVVYHAVWAKGSGDPEIPNTLIAKWDKQSIAASTAIKAKDKDGNTLNSVTMTSNVAMTTDGVYCYMNSSISTDPVITLAGLDFSDYSAGVITFFARGSQQALVTVEYSTDGGSSYSTDHFSDGTAKNELGYVVTVPNTTTNVKISYGSNTGNFYFGSVRAYGTKTTSYDFTELTSSNTSGWSGADWDGYYLIVGASNTKALRSDIMEGLYGKTTVSPSEGVISTSDLGLMFKVKYNSSTSKYAIRSAATQDYLTDNYEGFSEKYHLLETSATENVSITYNDIENASGAYVRWNSDRFGSYGSCTAPTLYKIMTTFTEFRITCCTNEITIGTPTKTGSGTVTFASGGDPVDVGGKVETCEGETTITATVTPTNGYQCTALGFSGGSVSVSPTIPEPFVPYTAATAYTLTFDQNTDATLSTTVTFTALVDHYIDNMHYNTTQNKSGNYGTAPTLSDESKGEQCTGLHYKFIGWIPESDMNMTTGVPTTTANMVAGGATGKYATGTNYYAIWAEEE